MGIARPLLTGIEILFILGIIFFITAIIAAVMRLASRNILLGFLLVGILMIVQAAGCGLSYQVGQMQQLMNDLPNKLPGGAY